MILKRLTKCSHKACKAVEECIVQVCMHDFLGDASMSVYCVSMCIL